MSRLFALGSGSRGNCFAVQHGPATLLLDAGFSAREIERRAEAVGLGLDEVVGIVLTHEHGDHTAGAPRLAQRLGVPVLSSAGTWARLHRRMPAVCYTPLQLMGEVTVGPFRILACLTSHDATEPVALAVLTPDGARVGLAYDLGRATTAVRYLLREANALVVEANHDEILLRASSYPASVRQRIAGSGGHLSNRAAADLIREIIHPDLGLVVLAHLSEHCNSADHARAMVEPALRAAGFQGQFHIAEQSIPLNPLPIEPRLRAAQVSLFD